MHPWYFFFILVVVIVVVVIEYCRILYSRIAKGLLVSCFINWMERDWSIEQRPPALTTHENSLWWFLSTVSSMTFPDKEMLTFLSSGEFPSLAWYNDNAGPKRLCCTVCVCGVLLCPGACAISVWALVVEGLRVKKKDQSFFKGSILIHGWRFHLSCAVLVLKHFEIRSLIHIQN